MHILLVISHPDDDAIFAGALQQRLAAHAWSVVCLTAAPGTPRGGELLRWQGELGTPRERLHFLGEVDDPEDYRSGRSSIAPEAVMHGPARARAARPSSSSATTRAASTGTRTMRSLHAAVAQIYPETPRLEFGYGCDAVDWELPCARSGRASCAVMLRNSG